MANLKYLLNPRHLLIWCTRQVPLFEETSWVTILHCVGRVLPSLLPGDRIDGNDAGGAVGLNFDRPIAANLLCRAESMGDVGLLKSQRAAAHSSKLLRSTHGVEFIAENGGALGVR